MRYTKVTLALLAAATILMAADPFLGNWKLNPAKTKYKTGTPPKEQTLAFTEEGKDLHVMVKGKSSDGKPISAHYTLPSAGGTGKIIEGAYEGVSTRIINAKERETTYTKGGKPVYNVKSKLSDDGKTLTINVNGMNALGQTVEGTNVYEKQ